MEALAAMGREPFSPASLRIHVPVMMFSHQAHLMAITTTMQMLKALLYEWLCLNLLLPVVCS